MNKYIPKHQTTPGKMFETRNKLITLIKMGERRRGGGRKGEMQRGRKIQINRRFKLSPRPLQDSKVKNPQEGTLGGSKGQLKAEEGR